MKISVPVDKNILKLLKIGDQIEISGQIIAARDASLPKLLNLANKNMLHNYDIDLHGAVIFHSAVSLAGVGPTSSNKYDIENTIVPLSRHGVRIHVGKGALSERTIAGLQKHGSIFAVTPPVSALLSQRCLSSKLVLFPELGMEAVYCLKVENFPAIIAVAQGRSIYD